jgi:N-acetylneuraminate synthase/N,N'-diacetyllegionaminate synthase
MVGMIRKVESGLGSGVKEITGEEAELRKLMRRSIVAARAIPKGATINHAMLAAKRPGTGIPPKFIDFLQGKRARERIAKDTLLSWEQVE